MRKILVIGGGGREHAIVWKLSKSKEEIKLYCAPGNGGISEIAECVDIKPTDIEGIIEFAKQNDIDLVFVAPDDPLALGLVDALEEEGISAFGPTKAAAEIEWSKSYSKNLMKKYSIPTADYAVFDNRDDALEYLKTQKMPIVVKADGLALGKGVLICNTLTEAIDAVNLIMEEKKFGEAGNKIIIEEFITGPEVSVLAFCDGKTILPMLPAQDHKRALDNDKGTNTGGMGTFAPTPKFTPEIAQRAYNEIFLRTVEALNSEGRPFKGVIFFGLMLTDEGPKVLEYNARLGDPETQSIFMLLNNDLLEIIDSIERGDLENITIENKDGAVVCVVMASGGYPNSYETGKEIKGLDEIDCDVVVFHAGTKKAENSYLTSGGRVLGVTAVGADIEEARENAYKNINKITFENAHYRKDIGIK